MGSRSQLYSLVALGSVVLAVIFFGPVLAAFPSAALGAVVVYAAVRLVDVAEFRRIGRFRRTELALALGTTVAVLALGALQGVLVAVGLSVLDLLHRVTRPHDGILGFVPDLPACTTSMTTRRPSQSRTCRLPVRLTALLRQRAGLH